MSTNKAGGILKRKRIDKNDEAEAERSKSHRRTRNLSVIFKSKKAAAEVDGTMELDDERSGLGAKMAFLAISPEASFTSKTFDRNSPTASRQSHRYDSRGIEIRRPSRHPSPTISFIKTEDPMNSPKMHRPGLKRSTKEGAPERHSRLTLTSIKPPEATPPNKAPSRTSPSPV